MGRLVNVIVLLCCVSSAIFSDPGDEEAVDAEGCVMELSCAECVPDAMPLVTSHAAAGGRVRAAPGDEVSLSCGRGRFLAYPLRGAVVGVCEGGRLRVRHDNRLRHLLELGCQEDVFEDVQHPVEHCDSPLQGRAYQTLEGEGSAGGAGAGGPRHLATVCFDADRVRAAWARASNAPRGLHLPSHEERSSPLSLLGNFNHMFDAKSRAEAARLFADGRGEHMTRRLRELLRHDRVSLAAQTLTAGRLLAPAYFDDQDMRVANFASNQVAVWASVAAGNLRHLHADVARLMRRARLGGRELEVYAGTHGVLSVRTGAGTERRELYLSPGRFPVPRYVWTVVHDPAARRALALVLLNDPLVAVSEIRGAVFCESACGRVPWLRALTLARRYESPVHGLVFCCDVHSLAEHVPEVPKRALRDVPPGTAGMLLHSFE